MIRSAVVVAALVLAVSTASAAPRRAEGAAPARPGKSLEAIAAFCRKAAYSNVQGRGRDKYIFQYFDNCLRNGGRI